MAFGRPLILGKDPGAECMSLAAEKVAKSVEATQDLNGPYHQFNVSSADECRGVLRPGLNCNITFDDVQFSYLEKPEATALNNANLTIEDGECVAIVGVWISGISTVACLFQPLYEPAFGLRQAFESF